MLEELKQLAEIVYKNHNRTISGIINKDYTLGNIAMYLHQNSTQISITALNIATQRQIDITAKKYSNLFNKYNNIAKISFSYKNKMPKIIIDLKELLKEEPKGEYKKDCKIETHYKLGYKYKENGSVHYRNFERKQFVDQWLKQGKERDMIKVSLEEFEVRKLKSENKNISNHDIELIQYLKDKFGDEYISKTKNALELLDREKRNRSLAGRKAKFNREQINKILELREDGRSINELAKLFKCGVATIHKIISENK